MKLKLVEDGKVARPDPVVANEIKGRVSDFYIINLQFPIQTPRHL